MQPTARLLLPLLLILAFVPIAHAEDDAPAAKVETETVNEPFGLIHFTPADDKLPEGWSLVDGAIPASAPTVASLTKVATDAGIPADKVQAKAIKISSGDGESAVLGAAVWISLDAYTEGFTKSMVGASLLRGWKVKRVGGAARLLVSWGSNAKAASAILAWQVDTAVRRLIESGLGMMQAARQERDRNEAQRKFFGGQAVIEVAGKTEPEASYYHALKGAMLERRDPDAALDHNRKALKPGAPVPAPDRWIVGAAFQAGQALLTKQDAAVLPEALAILERAVKAEAGAQNPFMRFGNRYNLACTYARMKKLDGAFKHLEASLLYLRGEWEKQKAASPVGLSQLDYPRHFEHARDIDDDLAPLREDARWAKVMAKCDPDPKPAEEPKKDGDK